MKIPILNRKFKRKTLHIIPSYSSDDELISLGCDCHSAHILDTLKFRTISYPFDWLYTDSKFAMEYVNKNIENQFKYFLEDLHLNHRNYIISSHYPYTEFFHEKNLIESETDRIRLTKRTQKFLQILSEKNCTFLHVINPDTFTTAGEIENFANSVAHFHKITDNKHQLKLFIKCKKSYDFQIIDEIVNQCKKIENVKIEKYFLDTDKYGMWGNPDDYIPLLKKLNINIQKKLRPRFIIR